MKLIIILLSVLSMAASGAVSLPRCYVWDTNCSQRSTMACPYSAASQQQGVSMACCQGQETDTSQSPALVPRFRVDQQLQVTTPKLAADPTPLPSSHELASAPRLTLPFAVIAHFCPPAIPPPIPLLLHKQSFLI